MIDIIAIINEIIVLGILEFLKNEIFDIFVFQIMKCVNIMKRVIIEIAVVVDVKRRNQRRIPRHRLY